MRAYYDVHPSADSTLTLDPAKKNRWGDPLPAIRHVLDAADRRRARRRRGRTSAASSISWRRPTTGGCCNVSEGNYLDHPSGGCRMGTDPATSVCDSHGRTHDHENLFVVGSPTLPTGGCTNATLTFVALTLRSAPAVAGTLWISSRGLHRVSGAAMLLARSDGFTGDQENRREV